MSLTASLEMDGDDFNGVCFTYTDGVVKMEFSGCLWSLNETKEILKKFLDEAKAGKFSHIEFEGSNGESSISHSGGEVSFSVAKYGGNGSGDMSFSLPLSMCVSAIESVLP
ncbi:hypothetical protein C8_31 [Cannes 8 virus]|uniref:hypothetical protein n=1 Tax=Melbournevirus TaxID=1560514 RepID=UPI000392B551|nr:hypothetical protein MEL_028 [Melbournevirus]AGV01380.1 hypothetical protein C8_31 [Cannes 8 virus]AIT54641.1 hypothetical protein MEL_028 [Melbournevirus]AVR52735.1 hypothetical protein MarSH_030 [Marseillevirus Shanghai 1]